MTKQVCHESVSLPWNYYKFATQKLIRDSNLYNIFPVFVDLEEFRIVLRTKNE